jgi:hypothetical protein
MANAASGDAANYTCVVTGGCGSATSSAVALTINLATSITTQPSPKSACIGGTASFTLAATGSGTLTYQWQKGGSNISGATSATYSIASAASGDAANYTCVVTGGCGSVTSGAAGLTINTATSIITQPSSVPAVCVGGTASFTVTATGSGTLMYQWQKGGANISGATSPTYSIASVASSNAGNYDCIVTGGCGSATSSSASLAVSPAPTFTNQPNNQNALIGKPASFSVTSSGSSPFSYQWKFNSQNISGATLQSYSIGSVAVANGGNYSCTVTDACGQSTTSSAAVLSIQCTVTYDGNGKTSGTAPSMATVNYNSSVTLPTTSLLKNGFVFEGWNTKNDGTGTTYKVGDKFTIYNNMYLYAIWQVWDIDGNQYQTVTIGQQTWMVENLQTTRLYDGTTIAHNLNSQGTPGYDWYNSDNSNQYPYGALYNLSAINSQKLAPMGWRVPSQDDWNQLISALSGSFSTSGFGPVLGGTFVMNSNIFQDKGVQGYWWSTSPINSNIMAAFTYQDDNNFGVGGTTVLNCCSVRCVLNQ